MGWRGGTQGIDGGRHWVFTCSEGASTHKRAPQLLLIGAIAGTAPMHMPVGLTGPGGQGVSWPVTCFPEHPKRTGRTGANGNAISCTISRQSGAVQLSLALLANHACPTTQLAAAIVDGGAKADGKRCRADRFPLPTFGALESLLWLVRKPRSHGHRSRESARR